VSDVENRAGRKTGYAERQPALDGRAGRDIRFGGRSVAVERYRVDYQAFDSADEWQDVLPPAIEVERGERPIQALVARLRANGLDCRLVKTSRGGAGESYLLNRDTPVGNSQAAIHLIALD
jgi:hypothetical protein